LEFFSPLHTNRTPGRLDRRPNQSHAAAKRLKREPTWGKGKDERPRPFVKNITGEIDERGRKLLAAAIQFCSLGQGDCVENGKTSSAGRGKKKKEEKEGGVVGEIYKELF